jgi:nucleoside-diphosphate-sugar epimerase
MSLDFSKILVTGGAGFIGSHIVDRLLYEGIKVKVLDNISTGEKNNLVHHQNNKSLEFIVGDIRDFDLVRKLVKDVDAVIHEAALVSILRSIEDPLLSNEINVRGTLNLLKACADAHIKRFVLASSCAVYGDSETLPNHENAIPMPLSPYAVDKLAIENYAKVFHKVYGLETVSLRYFNVYGSRQKYGPYSGVISIFIKRILENKPPIIFGNGNQTRDFVNIKDVVEANILALSNTNVAGKVFNIGTGRPTKINKLAVTIQEILGKDILKPVHTKDRLGNIRHSYGDITNAKQILEYVPQFNLINGLENLVEWYLIQQKRMKVSKNNS